MTVHAIGVGMRGRLQFSKFPTQIEAGTKPQSVIASSRSGRPKIPGCFWTPLLMVFDLYPSRPQVQSNTL